MAIRINQPQDDGDAGLSQGGSFYFMPAGQDGDTHAVSEFAARIIMGDPGLSKHFECTPPVAPPVASPAGQDDQGDERKRRRGADKG